MEHPGLFNWEYVLARLINVAGFDMATGASHIAQRGVCVTL